LYKVIGALQYIEQAVQYNPVGETQIVIPGLIPDTDYQFFLKTQNAQGITNGPLNDVHTQRAGCPTGQPVLLVDAPFSTPYRSVDPNGRASLTIYSSFANVAGAGLQCTAQLVNPFNQLIDCNINVQDNANLRSIHTFDNLDFDTQYQLFSVVENAFGFQDSTNQNVALTQLQFHNPLCPSPGFTGIYLTAGTGIIVSALPPGAFAPGISLRIEVSPDAVFTPATIERYAWIRTPNPAVIVSVNDLPAGQIRFVRSRIYDTQTASLRYSNVYAWDGVGAKRRGSVTAPVPSLSK